MPPAFSRATQDRCKMQEFHVGRRVRRDVPFQFGTHLGEGWRDGHRHEVFHWKNNVTVTRFDSGASGYTWHWRVTFYRVSLWRGRSSTEGYGMASKWITQAVAKAAGKVKKVGRLDPVLAKDRPALTDFLTELKGSDDKPRELSVLMVTVTSEGLRVGLKDDEAGGWCWREGATLEEALDAIEKALQLGDGAFRPSGGWKGTKRK